MKIGHVILLSLLCSCFILLTANVFAQANLVVNGDFEDIVKCPFSVADSNDQVAYANGWKRPTAGKSFYYNGCAPKNSGLSVPYNRAGIQNAKSGNGYMGLCAYRDFISGSDPGFKREYIQTELTQKLKAGRRYYFEMNISRGDSALLGYAVKNLGAYFSSTAISSRDSNSLNVIPQIETSGLLTDRLNWTKIIGSFVASGGEKYLTIGRFGLEGTNQVQNVNGASATQAYYYIDDVQLIDSCTTFDQVVENILGPDSAFCKYSSFSKTLDATNTQATQYLWKNGAVFPVITVTDTGKYWVRMSNTSCVNYDTVKFSSNVKPIVNLGPDTAICFNRTVRLKPLSTKPFYTYNWYIYTAGLNFIVGTNNYYDVSSQDFIIVKATDFGCSNYDTILVRRSVMDTLILHSDTTLCRQAHFLIDAKTKGATQYKWNTGDTSSRIYTSSLDNYWVTVTDGLCAVKDTMNVNQLGAVTPVSDTSACENTVLVISGDPTATSYAWNNGATTRSIFAYNTGIYSITQQKGVCTTTDLINVHIDKIPYVNLGPDTNVCIDPLYTITAYSPYATKYIWNTGDSTATIQIDSSKTLTVIASNKTCSYSDTVLIKTQLKVPFSFGDDVSDCFNTSIVLTTSPFRLDSFTWSTGSPDSFIVVTKPGLYWLRTHTGYCTNSDSISFFPKPKPIVVLRNDTTVCKGTSVSLDAGNAGNKFAWNTGENTQKLTIAKAGFYLVKVTNSENCYTTDSFNLYNFPAPIIFNSNKALVCKDSSMELHVANHFTSYQWDDGSADSIRHITKAGKYWVNIVDAYTCSHTDTANITMAELPVILIDSVMEACELNFTIEPNNTYKTYLWQQQETGSSYTVTKFGTIDLTVTDTNNCAQSITILIENNCPSSVKIPNVFTPNGDGFNDEIIPDYVHINSTLFTIYNRWGNVVFETNKLTEGWNGKTSTGDAPSGTYYYLLKCTGKSDQVFEQKGSITLIR